MLDIKKLLLVIALLYSELRQSNGQDNTASRPAGVTVYGDCSFNINKDLVEPQPIITPDGLLKWPESDVNGDVNIKNGDFIEMYCEQSFKAPFENLTHLRAQCLQGKYYLVDGYIHAFSEFSCTKAPTFNGQRTERTCLSDDNGRILEIGYDLKEYGFIKAFETCFNEDSEAAHYSYYELYPGSAKHQSGVSRPSFQQRKFYNKTTNVNNKYTQKQQQAIFEMILQKNVTEYFNSRQSVFLARGHLAAKADFVFGAAQMATFVFVNIAPQWQSFNGGNWVEVENSVRDYMGSENMYADIYTGVWGVMTLPDVNNEPKEIYLNFDENGNGLIPVPKLYYRVIIDKTTRKGIVLIGVNNPHASLEEIERDYVLCPDISDKITWVSWNKRNLLKGYSYACEVPEFLKVVQDLPITAQSITGILSVQEDLQVAFL